MKNIFENARQFTSACLNMKDKVVIRDMIVQYSSIIILNYRLIFFDFWFRIAGWRKNIFFGFMLDYETRNIFFEFGSSCELNLKIICVFGCGITRPSNNSIANKFIMIICCSVNPYVTLFLLFQN